MSIVAICDSARILIVFSTHWVSHQAVFRPVILELVRRGHKVTSITAQPIFKNRKFDNFIEIDVCNVSKHVADDLVGNKLKLAKDVVSQYEETWKALSNNFKHQLYSDEVKKLVANGMKFDVILTELCARSNIILGYIADAPVIEVSSFGSFIDTTETIGSVTHPALYPLAFRENYGSETILGQMSEVYKHYKVLRGYQNYEVEENEMLKRRFGNDVPPISEIRKKYVQATFLNVVPIWDSNRPVPPNLIYIGSLPNYVPKELPHDLKEFLDASEHGVIYMSFGTSYPTELLKCDTVNAIVKAFTHLPYSVVWKWDDVNMRLPEKIRLYKWVPQADLLRHPNVKLFITQAGLHSTDDAIQAGVPMLAIPLAWDQSLNAHKHRELGLGITLEPKNVSEGNLVKAIQAIIEDDRYRRNVKTVLEAMRTAPNSSLGRAVSWIEFVALHKNLTYLKTTAAVLTWREYYELDLFIQSTSVLTKIVQATFGSEYVDESKTKPSNNYRGVITALLVGGGGGSGRASAVGPLCARGCRVAVARLKFNLQKGSRPSYVLKEHMHQLANATYNKPGPVDMEDRH
ncbi:unnamed protein product [Leptosia nina]|uniref:Glucuronosyltransferase n=1 Tax=Leptosia nina TaxID=320188 RepID=A0AAV1JYX0_9NEOP